MRGRFVGIPSESDFTSTDMRGVSTLLPFRTALRDPGKRLDFYRLPITSGGKFHWRLCSSATWKNFSLEDELTLEIKTSIEKKWGKKVYGVDCPAERAKIHSPDKTPDKYVLSMFPYPSGRLHLGHVRVYTLSDVFARFHRMQGHRVVHPMGWDAFGLPAENAARDNGIDPKVWTEENIDAMKRQIIEMGCSFDWERELATCDPSYFKWTQWLFLKLWEKGLVYKKRAYVFWDPVDKTVLAEEQVDSNGRSWRSGAKVEKKLLQQWFVRTAVFAEQLRAGLLSGELKEGWRDVVSLQKHWIGEVKGFFCDVNVDIGEGQHDEPLRIWFSSVEELENAKYFILRPDHFIAEGEADEFEGGLKMLKMKIVNPATGEALPVFTGNFATLPCVPESSDCRVSETLHEEEFKALAANESFLNSIENVYGNLNKDAISAKKGSKQKFSYHPASLKLRDWLVSRQRKWGTPIPVLTCKDCGSSRGFEMEELPVQHDSAANEFATKCAKCGSENIRKESDTLDTFFDSSWYFLRYLDPQNDQAIFDPAKVNKSLPVDIYIGGKEHATLHLYYARFMTHFLHSLGLVKVTEPFQRLVPIGVVMGEAFIVKGSDKYVKPDDCVKEDNKYVLQDSKAPVYTKWEKMSKSKYNGVDPELVLKEYGVDTTRLLSMAEAAPTSARKWPPNNAGAYLTWQRKIWLTLKEFVDAKDFGNIVIVDDETWQKSENEIFDVRNHYLKGVNHDYAVTAQISVALSKLQALFGALRKVPKVYIKESQEFERALGAAIICLYPVMPAFSAQIWQSFRGVATVSEPEFDLDHEVWEQRWPSVDWRYRLDLVCKIKGEEYISKVERNYLDTLDLETALAIAFDHPQVNELLLSKENAQVLDFTVEPAFRATLILRNKSEPPKNTSSPTPSDKISVNPSELSKTSEKGR